jgi:hypothetical protein
MAVIVLSSAGRRALEAIVARPRAGRQSRRAPRSLIAFPSSETCPEALMMGEDGGLMTTLWGIYVFPSVSKVRRKFFGTGAATFIGAITGGLPSHNNSRHQAPKQERRKYHLRDCSHDGWLPLHVKWGRLITRPS